MTLAKDIHRTATHYDELLQNIVDVEDKISFLEDTIYIDAMQRKETDKSFGSESARQLHVRVSKHKHPHWNELENIKISLDSERRSCARNLELLNNTFKIKTAVLKSI